MNDTETVFEMYTPFTNIVNSFKALDKNIPNIKLVYKFLRSLLKCWELKGDCMPVISKWFIGNVVTSAKHNDYVHPLQNLFLLCLLNVWRLNILLFLNPYVRHAS